MPPALESAASDPGGGGGLWVQWGLYRTDAHDLSTPKTVRERARLLSLVLGDDLFTPKTISSL